MPDEKNEKSPNATDDRNSKAKIEPLSIGAKGKFSAEEVRKRFDAASETGYSIYGSLYDIFFHIVMGDPISAAGFLKAFFPTWAEYFDFDKLEVLPNEIYSKAFNKRIADLIYRVPNREKGEKALEISIVVEHKAQSGGVEDRRTIANAVYYLVSTSIANFDRRKSSKTPQTLAIVVYTGPDPKYDTPKWEDFFPLPKLFEEYQLRCKIPCVNLTNLVRLGALDELKLDPIVHSACNALGYAGDGTIQDRSEKLSGPLVEITDWTDPRAKNYLDSLGLYYTFVLKNRNLNPTRDKVEAMLYHAVPEKASENMKTFLDEIEAQSAALGEARGARNMLLNFLTSRYGDQASSERQEVEKITSVSVLNMLAMLVMNSSSFEEFKQGFGATLRANPDAMKPLTF